MVRLSPAAPALPCDSEAVRVANSSKRTPENAIITGDWKTNTCPRSSRMTWYRIPA